MMAMWTITRRQRSLNNTSERERRRARHCSSTCTEQLCFKSNPSDRGMMEVYPPRRARQDHKERERFHRRCRCLSRDAAAASEAHSTKSLSFSAEDVYLSSAHLTCLIISSASYSGASSSCCCCCSWRFVASKCTLCCTTAPHSYSIPNARDTSTIAIKHTTSPTRRASRYDARKYNTLLLTDNRLAHWEWCSLVSCSPARHQAERRPSS